MRRPARFALVGLLVASVAPAAEPAGCAVRKGLYDAWLTLNKRTTRTFPKFTGSATRVAAEPASAEEIYREYQTFFQCLSDMALPAAADSRSAMCADASSDRLGSLTCQLSLYVKTDRTSGAELLDALPASKKGAEMIWDLDAIADAGVVDKHFPPLFAPKGPAYKLIDEVFVLALDDRETAIAKYFHIVGAATGAGTQYTDSQIKILLRESPILVVKHWDILRQYQPKLKKLLAELAAELSAPDMNKVRQGIAGSCTRDNLDCPEIQKFFGRPQ
uniref:Secreted protein n=1 Tax=Solibacter usitatus (strain Ellin6076) TaxID=234267 RepID=Q022L2_SOLUE